MKKFFIAFTVTSIFAACNNTGGSKVDVKNDSTTLTAPETNSNMTDNHITAIDSSKVDSGHRKYDSLMAK